MATTDTVDERVAPGMSGLALAGFGALLMCLAAGYGVLFTIVDDYRDEYGISETAIGVVIGLGFITAFFAQLFIAPWADRGHARTVALAGTAVGVAGLLLMAIGTSLSPILIGRCVSGVGIGAAVPAVRRMVILADPANLGRNLGRLLSAEVFGFAMGPAISAVLVGPLGIPAPFLVVAGATTFLMIVVARFQVPEEQTTDAPARLALDLLRIKPFAGAVLLGAAVYVMIGAFDALWAVVHDDLGTADWMANLGITLFAIPLIVFGPLGGKLSQTYGPFRIATLGLLAGTFYMSMYGLLPSGGWIFTLAMVHAVTDGFTVSSAGVAVGMTVPSDRQAGAQGVLGAAQAVAAGMTAIAIGATYDTSGRTAAYLLSGALMLTLVVSGVWLARSAWSLRDAPPG